MKKTLLSLAFVGVSSAMISAVLFARMLRWMLALGIQDFQVLVHPVSYILFFVAAVGVLRLAGWGRIAAVCISIYALAGQVYLSIPLLSTGEISLFTFIFLRILPFVFMLWFFMRAPVRQVFEKRDEHRALMQEYTRKIWALVLLSGGGYMLASFLYLALLCAALDAISLLLVLFMGVCVGLIFWAVKLWGWQQRRKMLGITCLSIGILYLLGAAGFFNPGVRQVIEQKMPVVAAASARILAAGSAFVLGGILLIIRHKAARAISSGSAPKQHE